MEFKEVNATRIGVQHFHVQVGPENVNLYSLPGMDMPGPYVDIIVDDVAEAATLWINLINQHMTPMGADELGWFDEDDVMNLIDDIEDEAEDDEGWVAMGIEEVFNLTIVECWGCVPTHSN